MCRPSRPLPARRLRALVCVVLWFPAQALSQASAPVIPGVSTAIVYKGSAVANLVGGLSRTSTYSGNLNLQMTLDLENLIGWQGTTFYAGGLWIHGGEPGSIVGDAQGVSNISAPTAVQIEEIWLQKNFPDLQASALVGLYDINSEFYRLQSAELFLHSSFGIGPEFSQSGLAGPSIFPNTSLGVRFAYKPDPGVVVRAVILDGVPIRRPDGTRGAFRPGDGALLLSEVAFLARAAADIQTWSQRDRLGRFANLPGYDNKLAVGAWYYTATFDDLSEVGSNGRPARHHGSSGAYAIADRLLWRDIGNPDKRTTGFVQLGIGDSATFRFGHYLGAGVVATAPFGRRANDELGLGVAIARNGSHYMDQQRRQGIPVQSAEIAIELSYLAMITPRLALQPDLQYVMHPNTDPTTRDALAFALRFQITIGQ